MLDLEKLPPIFDTAKLAEWSGMPARRWADYRAQGIGPSWFKAGDGARQVLYTRDAVARWIKTKDICPAPKFGAGPYGVGAFGRSSAPSTNHDTAHGAEGNA